ncbi:spermidine/putrescine ABC transporter permease PotB [Aquicella lusitana]|uniref:Spermidine/putrescine transport system permease protein n=1 Tax=Aquicella lusitana TaxID=254246 RepID=A0A370GTF5_9COXI|nr:spermidine/putrescine ABC transporter permease PotB [Aquicella lusitana]RDI45203.1 spermidine/putrescine transport system permease protein [Aquicella lusitana]VVC72727.1 Spermidine/putrescine transport system permease protein PotB [Aquicella lusitana]
MKPDNHFKHFSLTVVWFWLFLFALLPFCLVIAASFMGHSDEHLIQLPLTLDNYRQLNNAIYIRIFEKSFLIAGFSTLLCLVIGYPFAYIIARLQGPWKNFLLLLVIIPFWTSSLIRSYALIAIIKAKGILNSLLILLGIIDHPLSILFTNSAVIIGLVYNLLPFMILPIMTNVERLDNRLVDAARDLGANHFTTFRRVIIPLTMPGIIAGCILVFLPAMTIFYIPDILGGAKSILLGNLIQNQFLIAENWPLGSAVSAVLTIVLATLILIYLWVSRGSKRRELL